jgi:type IV pilus assembly protein PilE
MKLNLNRGFTLIELMIVVAIVGILSSIAYPAYTESVLKGRRAQGRTALAELMQQQERYLTQTNTYLAFTNVGGTTDPATVPFKTFSGDNATNGAYLLSSGLCASGTGTFTITECVQVIATPNSADVVAGTLRMTSTGRKDCTGTASSTRPELCWP